MGLVKKYLSELDDENLMQEVEKMLKEHVSPMVILNECQEGMVIIGEKFAEGEMFVSDLMMSGALFKGVSEMLEPYLEKGDEGTNAGTVVLGTVKDDIHDIGKDIVHNMLKANGFHVIDLGVDVPAEMFLKTVKENNAKVCAMSCLLASGYTSIKATVDAFKTAGMRDNVKIIIGGGPIDQHVVDYSGADTYGETAQDTVDYCKEVLS